MNSKSVVIGAKIRALLTEAEISQEELAQRLQTSPSHVSRIVNGMIDVRVTTLTRIADELNVDVNELLDEAA